MNHSVSGSEISGCSQLYPGPPVDLRKAANGQSERMAAFGAAHFARERRGRAQCCQRIPSASGIENANSTIRPPPARYTTLELAGGAGEIRSRLTSSAYAASLSTNRKNRVLRARDLDLLSNIRSRADIALLAGRQDRLTFSSDRVGTIALPSATIDPRQSACRIHAAGR